MTNTKEVWTALVLAGQRPGIDPLAAHFGEQWKALVPIAGEAMVTHVVRTLAQTPKIGRIIVLGQVPAVLTHAVAAGGRGEIVTSSAGISASVRSCAGSEIAPWPVLVTTADHPLLTSDMIEAFLAQATQDLTIGMVEKTTMLASYPENNRTWLKFRDGHWSGANLFAMRNDRVYAALDLWAAAEKDRKKAWKLFLHFGPILAARALMRTIGLANALRQAGARLGLSVELVPLDQAEAAIDVDKPSDHSQAEAILKARHSE